MNKKFTGLYTALVTPFNEDKTIDFKALESLIEEQINENVDGIVILGTTAESPVIDEQEAKTIINLTAKKAKGKTKIIVGTGTNNTDTTTKKSKLAKDLGADAILVVNPYYNKPTQDGLYQHFMHIADNTDLPIMLYNIKGRTAVNIETETLLKLSKHSNIIGVKEASGDIAQIMDVINLTKKEDFFVLSGDDALTYPIMCLGGHGVISVLSNVLPREMLNIVWEVFTGNIKAARNSHYKVYPLMKALLSIASNPMPIKTLLSHLGKIKETFRLPLCNLKKEEKAKLINIYNEYLNG